MTYTKERNFIVCYDKCVKVGAWNITTGEFYGKSGNVVKNVPSCFTYHMLSNDPKEDFYSYAIRWFRERICCENFLQNYNGNRFEQLVSVGLLPRYYGDLNDDIKLSKDIVDYLKKNNCGIYNKTIVKNYSIEKPYRDKIKDMPEYAQAAFKNLIKEQEMPIDYIYNAMTRILLEHAEHTIETSQNDWTLTNRITAMIKNYYKYSMTMYHTVEVKRNFLTTLANLGYLYLKYKEEHFDEMLYSFNNIPALYFENDSFVAFPLLTQAAFHKEATGQNNCVEKLYMEEVAKGNTHIVAIRKTNDIDKPYITCEVDINGKIRQYLLKNNYSPYGADENHFKTEYQNYLDINFEKGV